MVKLAIILILALSAGLRFLTVPNLMSFTPDEAYQVYIAQTLIKNFHIIWIGMSAGGFDLYLGPLWIYIIYPALALVSGDPVILGYIGGFLGIVCTFLIFLFGKYAFGDKVGIVASLLYAASPLAVYYDQKPYPSAMSFLSILIALSLYMVRYSKYWWVVVAASYGMVFHIHLSLILAGAVIIYWIIEKRSYLNKKVIALSVATFIIAVSQLIAFDYFHKGSNILTPIRVLKSVQAGEVKPATQYHLDSLFEAFGRIWFLKPRTNSADEILYSCTKGDLSERTKPLAIVSLLGLALFVTFALTKKSWKDDAKRLLLLLSLSFLAPFAILPIINPVEYYLVGFLPLYFLIVAILITSFKKPLRILSYLFIGLFVILGILTVTTAKSDFGLASKKRLVERVMQVVGDAPYELSEEGDCHKYEGARYLFSVYRRAPERSSEDETFGWLHPEEITTKEIRYSVVVAETRANVPIKEGHISKIEEGGFTAYLYEK